MSERLIKHGQGWRLGWNPTAAEFPGLVGGEDWAIELTYGELRDFCRLAQELAATMYEMAGLLMDEEKITCNAESESLWLEASGYPNAYTLQLILNQGRRAEGYWSIEAVPDLMDALHTLTTF